MKKLYGFLQVRIIVEVDDTFTDTDIASTSFIEDYEFVAVDGASFVDTEIVDFDITDSK